MRVLKPAAFACVLSAQLNARAEPEAFATEATDALAPVSAPNLGAEPKLDVSATATTSASEAKTHPPATPPGPSGIPIGTPPTAHSALSRRALASASNATTARVQIAVDRAGTWLELRSFGTEPWHPSCQTPCGQLLVVDGAEARVTGPGMTPSGPFRIRPGGGTAELKVNAGSSEARFWGQTALGLGIPLAFVGMGGLAYGSFEERPALRTLGAISLGIGTLSVLLALPLLMRGGTDVRNAEGDLIASRVKDLGF